MRRRAGRGGFAQDAFVTALEQWPVQGVPDNPGAWLMAAARTGRSTPSAGPGCSSESTRTSAATGAGTARRRRHRGGGRRRHRRRPAATRLRGVPPGALHRSPRRARLRLLGGLTTSEIARAFLLSRPHWPRGSSRPSEALAEEGRLRGASRRHAPVSGRCSRSSTSSPARLLGDGGRRLGLQQNLRGRATPRAHPGDAGAGRARGARSSSGSWRIQASRIAARTGPSGEPVLLLDQNRALWDRLLIGRGLAALAAAGARHASGGEQGPYALQWSSPRATPAR